jgi:hypothetical protein
MCPNWAHSTLTVRGETAPLLAFVEKVKTDEQPLTFAAHVPDWPKEQIDAIDAAEMEDCYLCGGTGFRPRTELEALTMGVEIFHSNAVKEDVSDDERIACNGCKDPDKEWLPGVPGTGRRLPPEKMGCWWDMRLSQWGTKWDASFGEPFIALGSQEADVDVCIEAKGGTITPTVAIYKFDTAWSPPIPWLTTVAEMEPELEFDLHYGEPGNDFAGRIHFAGGVCVLDEECEVDEILAPEELWF